MSPHGLTAAAVVALAAMVAGEALWDGAAAADLGVPPPDFVAPTPSAIFLDPNRFEVRGGAFAHGVGSIEEGTVDVNLEFVSPRIPIGVGEWWSIFLPRFHIGGMLNTSNRTSYAYAGGLWTVPLWYGFFWEGFFGGAVHNGSLNGTPTQVALGCQPLFHVGGSFGYAFTPNWHIMATIDHVSNGNEVFGTDCTRNQGLNNYGLRIGYTF